MSKFVEDPTVVCIMGLHVWAQGWWRSIASAVGVPGEVYKLYFVDLMCDDLVPDTRIYYDNVSKGLET